MKQRIRRVFTWLILNIRAILTISVIFLLTFLLVLAVNNNTRTIDAIQKDRQERTAIRCSQDHQTITGILVVTNLISALLHQAVVPQPGMSPEQAERSRQYIARADELLKAANDLIAKGDCITPPKIS